MRTYAVYEIDRVRLRSIELDFRTFDLLCQDINRTKVSNRP